MLDPNSRGFRVMLGAQSMVSSLAIDMSLPALPAIAVAFSADAGQVQHTIRLYLLGYALGQLFYGPFSDRFGRRPLLIIGVTIYTVSGFACAVAPTIEIMNAFRLLQGLGGCVGVVVSRAAARDYFSGSALAQTLSSITAFQAFGPLMAPVLGGILATYTGWHSIFLVQGIFAAFMLGVTWFGFGESLPQANPYAIAPRHLLRNYWTFFSNPRCIGFALVSAFVFSGLFAVLSASPFVLITLYGLSSQMFGFFFGASVLGYMLGAFGNRRLLLRGVAADTLMRYGLVILVFAGAAMLYCASERLGGVAGIMLPYVVYCIAISFVQSNSVAAAMEPVPHMAGTGASLMGAIQMASAAGGGWLVNYYFNGTGTPMGIAMALAAVGAMAAYWLVARRRRTV